MPTVYRQIPLYAFLLFCNRSALPREILDCGAGGDCPPLCLFAEHGYKTFGIECDGDQLERADSFARNQGMNLNIRVGDMRQLPFLDNSISHAFSYNTIFHMRKADIALAISELRRVMRPGGLLFVNFMSVDDFTYGKGEKVGEGEYLQGKYLELEDGQEILHSYHDFEEPEQYFTGFSVQTKEIRQRHIFRNQDETIHMGFIDYILEKNENYHQSPVLKNPTVISP